MVTRIFSGDADQLMPPPETKKRLSSNHLNLIPIPLSYNQKGSGKRTEKRWKKNRKNQNQLRYTRTENKEYLFYLTEKKFS